MTRLFDDEQSSSLITSMMNPESNASKFIEQGEDIGLPRDVTMDILNKYATYGANTGIGNLGGEKLVNALNEEYRKRVDEPLQNMSIKAQDGGLLGFFKDIFTKAPEAVAEATPEVTSEIDQLSSYDQMLAKEVGLDALNQEALNSPVNIEPPTGETVLATEQPGRLERIQKYLEDNPLVARQLTATGKDLGKLLGSALVKDDKDRKAPIRAPRPRFQPGQVRTQRIGMAAGGKPEEGSVLGRKLFIQGGEVDGPGGPKEDLVPIWASDKEYVVSEKGVRNMGGGDFEKGIAALDKINFGKRNV